MNSIISPWVFYWIGIVDNVRTITNRCSNCAFDWVGNRINVYYV